MRRALRLFFFLLVFTVDVKIHAREIVSLPNQKDILQEPQKCLLRSSYCAVKTSGGEKFKMQVGVATVVLDAGTSVIRLSRDEIVLVEGTVWVREVQGNFTVRTEFGEVVGFSGDFWASRTRERMLARATSGELMLKPRGGDSPLRLDLAQENWISGVRSNGMASTGIPTVIDLQDHIANWARLYPGTKKQFERDLRQFHMSWREAVFAVADFHQELVERKLASLKAEEERLSRIRNEREKRDRFLREMFRKKNYLD